MTARSEVKYKSHIDKFILPADSKQLMAASILNKPCGTYRSFLYVPPPTAFSASISVLISLLSFAFLFVSRSLVPSALYLFPFPPGSSRNTIRILEPIEELLPGCTTSDYCWQIPLEEGSSRPIISRRSGHRRKKRRVTDGSNVQRYAPSVSSGIFRFIFFSSFYERLL